MVFVENVSKVFNQFLNPVIGKKCSKEPSMDVFRRNQKKILI